MNEYGVDLPLWAADGLAGDDDFPISEKLRERLMAWASTFNEHFDDETGWDDEQTRRAHRTEGLALHRQLIEDLGPGYNVSFSLWESDVHEAETLLAGPRGRRLCIELAAQDDRIWTAVVTASRFFEVEQGAPYRLMALYGTDPQEEDDTGDDASAVTADETVGGLVRLLEALDLDEPPAWALHAALVQSVDWARYWQEPDGIDVLADQHGVRNALVPLAEKVMQTPSAQSWSALRGVEQWVIDWRSPDDPAPLLRDPARILADWAWETRDEEARAAVERPQDPTANWGGTWWSVPLALIHSTGQVPEGLDLIEDRTGEEQATVIPVRGVGKTYEVRTEYDWTWLCGRFPLEVTASRRHDWYRTTGRDGRWVIPDWEQVATAFDAVHLTTMAYLSSATRALPVGSATATVLAGWDPGTTIWLTDVVREWEGPRQSWRLAEDESWGRES